MLYDLIDGFTTGVIAANGKYWSWRTVMWLFVAAVCLYGGWQALQPGLTGGQRFVRFGVPVILVAMAFLIPMPPRRT
jgi:quinol-cytochrome oxidoreductase complex cytochrome b subunit